jgi:hypothetical protein
VAHPLNERHSRVAHPFQSYRKGWVAFAVPFLPLPLLLRLRLRFSCHPSPKAEDLLLLLPILVFAVACSFRLSFRSAAKESAVCRCLCF